MESRNYKIWLSVIDERRCGNCERKQGKLIPVNAADVELPPNYISEEEAKKMVWKSSLGNLDKAAPGRMMGGKIFMNRREALPAEPGRIWYEADINYSGGFRETERILYSNDGLLFASYDHYETFVELL